MLTDEQRAEGWIEWHGGECPVPLDSRPGVMFRDGRACRARITRAGLLNWSHGPSDYQTDIIAYKPEVPND